MAFGRGFDLTAIDRFLIPGLDTGVLRNSAGVLLESLVWLEGMRVLDLTRGLACLIAACMGELVAPPAVVDRL